MKKTSLNILGTITVLTMAIAFSGCESVNPQLPPQPANTQVQPPIATQQEVATAENTQESAIADQVAFDGARQLRDITFCQKIVNTELKQSCVTMLNDTATQEAAVNKMDPSLCDKMSTAALQKGCRMRLEVEEKNQAKRNKSISEKSTLYEMMAKKDFSACDSFTDIMLKTECEFNKVKNDALTQKNPDICAELKDDNLIGQCTQQYFGSVDYYIEAVNQAVNSKDIAKCSRLKMKENQKACEDAYKALTTASLSTSQQEATQNIITR